MNRFMDYRDFEEYYEGRYRRRAARDWVNPDGENYTKSERPYSYSEFFLWRSPGGEHDRFSFSYGEGTQAVYSDRLWQWDYEKAQAAHKEVFGRVDTWHQDQCSKFLTAYFGKPIEALACAEGCNPSNGYPYYIFWYREVA